MNKTSQLILLLATSLVGAASHAADLKATAWLSQSTFTASDEIYVNLRLKNTSDRELQIKAPFSLFTDADSRATVNFLIEQDGYWIQRRSKGMTGGVAVPIPPSIRLKPGAHSDSRLHLSSFMGEFFRQRTSLGKRLPSGEYNLRIKYYFTRRQADLNKDNDWIGEVVSNPVFLKVGN